MYYFNKIEIHLIIISIVIGLSLLSCKTIILDDEQGVITIPQGIELITISAGAYSSGESGIEKYIDYDYEIMKYPVTNAQYLDFLIKADSMGLITIDSLGAYGQYYGDKFWSPGVYQYIDFNAKDSRIGYYPPDAYFTKWRYVNNRKEYYDNHPVTHVTCYGAIAFAKFYGMRLPTTEEWEKAARANSGNKYPWGDIISSQFANYKDSGDEYDNDTTPVWYFNGSENTEDSYSPYGVYDMAGNVWEWTDSYKNQSPGKTLKGGSWRSKSMTELYTWFESTYGYSPNNSSHDIGFRCVKILK